MVIFVSFCNVLTSQTAFKDHFGRDWAPRPAYSSLRMQPKCTQRSFQTQNFWARGEEHLRRVVLTAPVSVALQANVDGQIRQGKADTYTRCSRSFTSNLMFFIDLFFQFLCLFVFMMANKFIFSYLSLSYGLCAMFLLFFSFILTFWFASYLAAKWLQYFLSSRIYYVYIPLHVNQICMQRISCRNSECFFHIQAKESLNHITWDYHLDFTLIFIHTNDYLHLITDMDTTINCTIATWSDANDTEIFHNPAADASHPSRFTS